MVAKRAITARNTAFFFRVIGLLSVGFSTERLYGTCLIYATLVLRNSSQLPA
jgi:hypothetical protein